MHGSPLPQTREDGAERLTIGRHAIAHAEPARCELLTFDQLVRKHLAQLFAQHLRRHAWQCPLQLIETVWMFGQALEDHRLPSALDHGDGRVERTSGALGVNVVTWPLHCSTSAREGTSKCPIVSG